ncbi:hypothetical protein PG984_003179 [Apiospora sp. TS-2023a]
MLRLWIIFVAFLQVCLIMGSPIGDVGAAVVPSVIPNPSAPSAAAVDSTTNTGGIVAAGLSDAGLERLYASTPEAQWPGIKVIPRLIDYGYIECYPLYGPHKDNCTALSSWIVNRSSVTDTYQVDQGYCWDAQNGDCRAFMCAEGEDGWAVEPGFLAEAVDSVIDHCMPNATTLTQSGAWHANWTGYGGNVYVTLF